ncbi:hypothetical protein EYB26_009478 [Talaromyces marneffei]|uniref:uncharacterized protein n=1 Tax=Talaromyces marneffei TaxID=37727 RepID=UPI0012A9D3DD|nr:uncharacterized protein EYB26_009478 [Talaromyces marneffei]QGA21767.1 hypothetical protein EYB26_009478 [Talaromyces marneffei]
MKFLSSLVVLGLSAQALASPYVDHQATKDQRDVNVFKQVLEHINLDVQKFDQDITQYQGGDPTVLLADSNAIIKTTEEGIQRIGPQPPLSVTEALALVGPVQGVNKLIMKAVDHLIEKKDPLVGGGYGPQVKDSLERQAHAASQLSELVSSKVPSPLAPISKQLSDQVAKALQKGIQAFSISARQATKVKREATKVQRDISAFQKVIRDISLAVNKFNVDIERYVGGDASHLLADGNVLIKATLDGVQSLQNEPPLSSMEALALVGPVQDLSNQILLAIQNLIGKKEPLVQAGFGGKVENNLRQQEEAAQKLSELVSTKVPPELADISRQLSDGIAAGIKKGIDAFAGTGPAPTTSSTPEASTAPAPAPAPSTPPQTPEDTLVPATSTPAPGPAPTAPDSSMVWPTSTTASPDVQPTITSSGTSVPAAPTGGNSSPAVPAFTGAASANQVSGAVGLAAGLLAVLAF